MRCVLLVSAIMWCLMPTTVSNRIFMLLLLFFQAVYRAPRAGPFTLVPTLRRMLGFTRCVPCMCYECCCLRCATGCERLLFAVACWLLPCTLCYVPLYDIADACVVYWCMLWASLAGIAVYRPVYLMLCVALFWCTRGVRVVCCRVRWCCVPPCVIGAVCALCAALLCAT